MPYTELPEALLAVVVRAEHIIRQLSGAGWYEIQKDFLVEARDVIERAGGKPVPRDGKDDIL